VAENISFMEQVTNRLQSINEEGAEDRKATRGKGIQSSLLRDQIKILEVIASSIAMLNNNFEEFMQNQALASLKGLDPEDRGGVTGKTSGAPGEKEADDAGFLFDSIVTKFVAFGATVKLFGSRLLNFIKRIALPITAVVALVTGFLEDFEAEEGTLGEKIVAGLGGAVQKLVKWLIAVPSQMIVDLAAWLARQFGAEEIANYLDQVDVVKMWEDLLGGIGEFLKPLTDKIVAGIDWLNGEEGQEIRDKISNGMTAVMNFLTATAKGFADILHFFSTGNELGVVSQIVEMYQKIMEWFSSLPGKVFDRLPEFAQAGLKAVGFSPEAAYDPTEVSAGGNTRSNLTEELDEAESEGFNNRSIPPTVIVAPQSSSTNVNSSTTNITASSGPVRDPSHLKQRGRGSHL
jgi:hypothetical protein